MKPAVTDPPEIEAILWDGFTGDLGWDVGANCGQSVPEMQTRFTQVLAFEPAAECWPYLKNTPGLIWLPIGLSDVNSDVPLIAVPDKISTGQLVTAGTFGMEWSPNAPGAVTRKVTCRTADSLLADGVLNPPDFMKIDVEGHELRVLYGAKKTLAVHRPALLIEFHAPSLHHSIIELLKSYGYTVHTVRHPHYPQGSDMWHQHGWVKATQ